MGANVIAKCIGCGEKREIKAGEVSVNDCPICNRCGMPMVVISAKSGKGVK